jgi:hypothetical protein
VTPGGHDVRDADAPSELGTAVAAIVVAFEVAATETIVAGLDQMPPDHYPPIA